MTVLYFTNNADSGDGSLRGVLSTASDGDVVRPDPTAFASVDSIVVALNSVLALSGAVTIEGNGKRIVLDGQGAVRPVSFAANTTATLSDVDIVNGKATGGGVYIHLTTISATFNRCSFSGCESTNYGGAAYILNGSAIFNDCIISGNRSSTAATGGGVRVASSATSATFNRCTITGNAGLDLTLQSAANTTVNDCIVGKASNFDATIPASKVGFVAAPADSIAPADWSADLWKTYDVRLAVGSPCLTGATGGVSDFFGHARKINGALGAVEGSHVVVKAGESIEISTDTVCDYLVVEANATVEFVGVDRRLTALSDCSSATSSTFIATAPSSGYIGTPNKRLVGSLSRVKFCTLGVSVVSIDATIYVDQAQVKVVKTGRSTPLAELRAEDATDWASFALSSLPFKLPTAKSVAFRVYDGEKFTATELIPRTYYYAGTTSGGSFDAPNDWKLDEGRTVACVDAPTISGCTFVCK